MHFCSGGRLADQSFQRVIAAPQNICRKNIHLRLLKHLKLSLFSRPLAISTLQLISRGIPCGINSLELQLLRTEMQTVKICIQNSTVKIRCLHGSSRVFLKLFYLCALLATKEGRPGNKAQIQVSTYLIHTLQWLLPSPCFLWLA